MNSDHLTPRVDGTLLQNFRNQTVRIVGRVDGLNDTQVTFYTPSYNADSTTIQLTYSPDLSFEKGYWYEIIGRVSDELSVRAIDVNFFGDNINEKAIAGLVHFAHRAAPELYLKEL
ncbi:hypothetical protein WICMUC_004922 [Wickerhamomyces mucosus]|uniref:Replication factor A protein 3 n=1 Tax=Wickerhamomyces mucosus TaxID=1378264 RepID=A0A9P8PF25_9ASCO|nr:hypothetical protein WICMUC_004922 [Wickerhamomyces mucosus]